MVLLPPDNLIITQFSGTNTNPLKDFCGREHCVVKTFYHGSSKMKRRLAVLLRIGVVLSMLGVLGWSTGRKELPLPTAETLVVRPPTPAALRDYWVVRWAEQVSLIELATHGLLQATIVPPELALQVSRAENWRGLPGAWSPIGCCVGVMQVHVAEHYGNYDKQCGGSDLMTTRDNACYGVYILRDYLRECRWAGAVNVTTCAVARYGGGRSPKTRARYLAFVREYGDAL